jgi:D-alanine-D-alanine ligase
MKSILEEVNMKRVLIITGPGGDAQGWGNLEVTKTLSEALNSDDKSAEIAFVNTMDDFLKAIDNHTYDIVWSALYYISDKEDIIGLNIDDDAWLADKLDRRQIPYIGPSARTMKDLIDKTATHRILSSKNIAVPEHHQVDVGGKTPDIRFPAFVKPSCESRSVGISDNSVVQNMTELEKQIAFIHGRFEQPALIEDYLPGEEYTVLMIGNGEDQTYIPGVVTVKGGNNGKFPILRSDMRGVGITKIGIPEHSVEAANALCIEAVEALSCLDHVRVDMRFDAHAKLKIIEVNGIPGLKPIKSWSPQMFTLYNNSPEGPLEDYRLLLHKIVDSGLNRYKL